MNCFVRSNTFVVLQSVSHTYKSSPYIRKMLLGFTRTLLESVFPLLS